MCGKIMTVLLIFVLIVLICSMARYNGRLHCIVGGLTHLLHAQSSPLLLPPGWHGALGQTDVKPLIFSMQSVIINCFVYLYRCIFVKNDALLTIFIFRDLIKQK